MREEVSRIHNVVPIEVARGRGRHGGRLRFRSAQVGDLTSRLRRRDAAGTLEWATAEERTRGKLRGLVIREIETWLGTETSVIKGLGVPGRSLHAVTYGGELTFIARLKELGDRQEATEIFVTDGSEVCMFEGDYRDLGQSLVDAGGALDLGRDCLRAATGDELMRLCQDLTHRSS